MGVFRTTLGHKLLLLYLLLFIIAFTFLHTLGRNFIEKKVCEESTHILKSTGEGLLNRHIIGQMGKSYTEDIRFFQSHIEFSAETIDCRILIINYDGDILIDTSNKYPNNNIYRYDTHFLNNESTINLTMGDLIPEPVLCIPFRVQDSLIFTGHLVLMMPMSMVSSRVEYYFNILDSLFYIIMFSLAIIFILMFAFTVLPIRKIIKATSTFSIRRTNPPIKIAINNEYRDLAVAINAIGDELNKFDEYQKNFIANISHDFRSPLTSIRGYTVAMKDGTIPTDMFDKYLNIILYETDRLITLTSDMLELSTFVNKNILLHYSTFDIVECIKKTIESLERNASLRNVFVDLNSKAETPMNVYADIGKIQQVLYNLIDNAIKFSSHGGNVIITTRKKGYRVLISIKDNGIGIPKEDIGNIWKRFYKSDYSRGKDKKGTGLGLCICQEILSAHNQKIDVISTEGIGTEFIFSLIQKTHE